MLRMTLREPGDANPDAKFMTLMQDYVKAQSGREPSTHDFKKAVESHMVPALDATRDGKVDWFFDQWVYGTEIPRYVAELRVQEEGPGLYRLKGTARQEGVSAAFRALLPLYVEFDKGSLARVGVIPMKGTSTVEVDVPLRMPKKPKRALVNALHDVLARD